jgi:hypothetical protein
MKMLDAWRWEQGTVTATVLIKIIILAVWYMGVRPKVSGLSRFNEIYTLTTVNTRWKATESGIWWEGLDWIHLVQDRDQSYALVKTAMNIRVPKKRV